VGRIRTSWELGKISWGVLKSDRTLAWFPILTLLVSLVVMAAFGGLIAATGVDSANDSLEPIGWVFVVVAYIALAFVGTYFLGALVHGANERLEGREASLGRSLGAANGRLHRIIPWAVLQGTVSVILSALEERAGWLGQIVVRLIGAAWAVVTFLTVPVIMFEDLGPIDALKRSGTLLKQTWGENLLAQAGFGLLGLVASLPGIFFLVIGITSDELALAVPLVGIGAVWILVVTVVIQAMGGIYRTALYRFAIDGAAPPAFASAHLDEAFRRK
jgi:hypothetical protein